jgi:hypothetical protein
MLGVDAMKSGIEGAMSAGTLKEAKIVILSRRQKSEYETLGIVGAAMGCEGIGGRSDVREIDGVEGACDCGADCAWGGEAPNNFAKRASLYTQMAILTAVVEMNLAGPGVTVE